MITISGTILGGVIAAVAGLAATGYSLRAQSKKEKKNWYRQLEHLAKRLDTNLNEEDQEDVDDLGAQQQYEQTADVVIPEIERHLGSAKEDVPEYIFDSLDTMTTKYINIKQIHAKKRARTRVSYITSLADEAEKIESWACTRRESL